MGETRVSRIPRATIVLAVILVCWCRPARAWIYPEHRQISSAAWEKLPPHVAQFYTTMWQRARGDQPSYLCASPVIADQTRRLQEPCIELIDWPAIAADHSCSPDQLAVIASSQSWVLDVSRISEQIAKELEESHSTTERENLWITSNLRLQAVDHEYVTRAGGNSAHFSPVRAGSTLAEQIAGATQDAAALNAVGLYVKYHVAALRLAAALESDAPRSAQSLPRQVLALEAYALHFLQDMFASGHVAGSWGDAATRKGTHDLALISPSTLTNVAIQAASGGLIPWQRTLITPVGHFEFVLGRALGVTFYGLAARVRAFALVDAEDAPESNALIEAGSRAVTLTFPLLEYTPLRIVAQALTASLQLQLAYAVEIPFDVVRYGPPTLAGPDWGPAHLFLLRISLSGRGYL